MIEGYQSEAKGYQYAGKGCQVVIEGYQAEAKGCQYAGKGFDGSGSGSRSSTAGVPSQRWRRYSLRRRRLGRGPRIRRRFCPRGYSLLRCQWNVIHPLFGIVS